MKNRKRNRLIGYDYSQDNLYFVTICVKGMVCCFGEILPDPHFGGTGRDLSVTDSDGQSPSISDSNKIMVLNEYGEIAQSRLLWLADQYPYVLIHNFVVMPNHVHAMIEIDCSRIKDKFIKIKSLSSLLGAFKTTSSKIIHESGFLEFSWHRSFHDHIIRNDKSYNNISNYIDQNPSKWDSDKFFNK